MLEIGSLLDGKYKILNEIGRGGMSVVYLALNERANKAWAVKEVRKDSGWDTAAVSQGLAAETEMLKKLDHPNLPSIVDVIDQKDSFIIVMDYIEGKSLQDLLDTGGPQPPDKVIEWAKQLCDVLVYLHSRRPPIIYRDMKPANIILRPDGRITLIDFGIAREFKNAGKEDTAWLGTRGYAAPEQFGGRGQTDGRTDLYNLGATMYHLVTGLSPAETDYVIYPVGRFIPRLKGSGLEKLIARCCEPAAADRYQSAAELMYALDHVHEEDNEAVRSRSRKWYVFIGFTAAAAAALIAGCVFRSLYDHSLCRIYESFLSDAGAKTALTEKIGDYRLAIETDPGRPEAWDSMIRAIQDRDHEILTSAEVDEIRNCIRNGAAVSNLEQLKKSDREAYVQFNYDLGVILFFSSDNGRSGAYEYLGEAAADKKHLSSSDAEIAEIMFELAEADRNKNRDTSYWSGGRGYREYWDMLNNMVNGRMSTLGSLERECGSRGYPLAVCNEVASAVYRFLPRFKGQGVSAQEMSSALQCARIYVEETFCRRDRDDRLAIRADLDENMKNRVEGALDIIGKAEKYVEMSFGEDFGEDFGEESQTGALRISCCLCAS